MAGLRNCEYSASVLVAVVASAILCWWE